MAELTLEQRRALALARARQAHAQSVAPTGADAMRVRGLSTDPADTAEMNAQATAAMRSPMQKVSDGYGQFAGGAYQGLTGLLGAPSDLSSLALSAATGKDIDLPLGADDIRSAHTPNRVEVEPRTETERRLRVAGEYVGPGMAVGGAAGIPGLLTATAGDTAAGLAAGEVRERDGGPIAEIVAALVAGGIPLGIANKVSKASQTKRAIDAAPDIDTLKGQASALYDAGEATGKTAARTYTTQLSDTLSDIATREGLISPTGRMSSSYPKVADALTTVKDYAGQKMTPEQMRQVRKTLQNAAQSADGSEARIGSMMLKQFDKFVEPLVPEFKQADGLWARASKGGEVKEAIDIAMKGRRTPPETALSNEFQNLHRKEIRGDLTYPDELVAAIEKVSNGGGLREAASLVGKAAPTGVVSGGFGLGATGLGAALGGPALGAAAGAGTITAGTMGRLLANRLTKGDARAALATALNGAPLPQAQTPEAIKAAIAALLASTAASGPQ